MFRIFSALIILSLISCTTITPKPFISERGNDSFLYKPFNKNIQGESKDSHRLYHPVYRQQSDRQQAQQIWTPSLERL